MKYFNNFKKDPKQVWDDRERLSINLSRKLLLKKWVSKEVHFFKLTAGHRSRKMEKPNEIKNFDIFLFLFLDLVYTQHVGTFVYLMEKLL